MRMLGAPVSTAARCSRRRSPPDRLDTWWAWQQQEGKEEEEDEEEEEEEEEEEKEDEKDVQHGSKASNPPSPDRLAAAGVHIH
jgi:ribosomal protein L12E/L44/L45/RPP1/RPP2